MLLIGIGLIVIEEMKKLTALDLTQDSSVSIGVALLEDHSLTLSSKYQH